MATKNKKGFMKVNLKKWEDLKSLVLIDVSAVMRTYYIPTDMAYRGYNKREPLSYMVGNEKVNTSAIYGLFETLRKIGHHHDFIFCFDLPFGNHVKDIDSSYKANRQKKDYMSEYFYQVDEVRNILEKVGYNCLFEPKFEADHMIFKAVETNKNNYEKIAVLTNDMDLSWLVDEKVSLINVTNSRTDVTLENYEDVLECPYNAIFLKKSLVGDSADNIKGVTRFGKAKFKDFAEKNNNFKTRQVKNNEEKIISMSPLLNDEQKEQALHCLRLIKPIEPSINTKYVSKEIDNLLMLGFLNKYGIKSKFAEYEEEF